MPTAFQRALDQVIRSGGSLPAGARQAAAASLQKFSSVIAENILQQTVDDFFGGIQSILNPKQEERAPSTINSQPSTATIGATPQSLRADILEKLRGFGSAPELAEKLNLDFKIKVAREVAQGAGRFVADQTNVDEYPAWELKRVYDRDVPRGEEPTHPSDPWPTRWVKAAESIEDGEDLIAILQHTGRMVALKDSPIWQALGDGAGGYDDALGNPFAPFAFNSGFDTEGVSYNDCVEIGLLRQGQKPEPANYDWSKLINLPEAA